MLDIEDDDIHSDYINADYISVSTDTKCTLDNGAGNILLLGGGETHGFSNMRENMHFFIQDKILLGGGATPPSRLLGGGAVAPLPPASGGKD